jgi:mannosyltransferase
MRPIRTQFRIDAVLVAIVLGGGVVRFWGLGSQSLWYDEWLTAETASVGLTDLVSDVAHRQGFPPTYFALLWGWVRVFGDSEVALRVVSALAGTATVPLAYAVARRFRQRRPVARVAALLVAVNPMLVWYSQEARPYSLLALFGVLSLLAFAPVWQRGGRRDLVVWSLVCAGVVALHYFGIFLVAAEALALLARHRDEWRRVALACVPSAAVLAAVAPIAATQHSHEANRLWISGFPFTDRLSEAGHSALVGPGPPGDRWWIAVALVVAVAVLLGATRARPDDRRVAALLAGVGGGAVMIAVLPAIVGLEDVVVSRYLIASLVPLIIAVAVALTTSTPRWIGGFGAALVAVVSLTTIVAMARDPDLQKPDWRAVADAVETGDGDRALVLNVGGTIARPLFHYLRDARALGNDASARVDEIDVLSIRPLGKPCNFLVGRACAFVFLGAPLPEPLASRLTLVDQIELDQFTIERYRVDSGSVTITKADLVVPDQLPGALVVVDGDR